MIQNDGGSCGLTRVQVVTLRDAVERHGTWTFDEFVSCEGETSAMATHDPTVTTLVMSAATGQIEVAELRNDRLWPLICFGNVAAAASFIAGPQLCSLLGQAPPMEQWQTGLRLGCLRPYF